MLNQQYILQAQWCNIILELSELKLHKMHCGTVMYLLAYNWTGTLLERHYNTGFYTTSFDCVTCNKKVTCNKETNLLQKRLFHLQNLVSKIDSSFNANFSYVKYGVPSYLYVLEEFGICSSCASSYSCVYVCVFLMMTGSVTVSCLTCVQKFHLSSVTVSWISLRCVWIDLSSVIFLISCVPFACDVSRKIINKPIFIPRKLAVILLMN